MSSLWPWTSILFSWAVQTGFAESSWGGGEKNRGPVYQALARAEYIKPPADSCSISQTWSILSSPVRSSQLFMSSWWRRCLRSQNVKERLIWPGKRPLLQVSFFDKHSYWGNCKSPLEKCRVKTSVSSSRWLSLQYMTWDTEESLHVF